MQNKTTKSPELIQAQIAAFAAERIPDFWGRDYILRNIGALSLGEVGGVTRITTTTEYRRDPERGEYERVGEGTTLPVASGEDYLSYLREVGGHRHEEIAGRAEILGAYDRFSDVVEALKSELADPTNRMSHARHLGSGANADVFAVTVDGVDYAVRLPKGNDVKPSSIDDHLGGAVIGNGLPHMEKIVAASYEDGVTVAEMMPGKEVGHITAEDVASITDEQLGQLVDTLLEAYKRGIIIDPKPSNFYYDKDQGFGIVDYHSSKTVSGKWKGQQAKGYLSYIVTVLGNVRLYGHKRKPDMTRQDYTEKASIMAANSDLMKRFRGVIASKLASEDYVYELLEEIDRRIASNNRSVTRYLDDEWVSNTINEDRQRALRQSERAKTKNPTKPEAEDLV